MSVILDFLKTSMGRKIWIDLPTQDQLFEGVVEAFDEDHVLISGDLGLDCINIAEIICVSLPKQTEIVAP